MLPLWASSSQKGLEMPRKKSQSLRDGNKAHPLYTLWYGIQTRCYNASKHNYPYYQGKGIIVCDEWLNSLDNFYKWAITNGWEKGLTIDRIDSDKNYCPENCRFISLTDNSKKSCVLNKIPIKRRNQKLNEIKVIEIKKDLSNNIPGVKIAKKYGVDKSAIYKIKHNKRWKDVTVPCI